MKIKQYWKAFVHEDDGAELVEYAIVAENTVIDEDAHVGDSPEAMADHLDDWGIAVIGEKITIGKGAKVDAKQMIDTDVEGESK